MQSKLISKLKWFRVWYWSVALGCACLQSLPFLLGGIFLYCLGFHALYYTTRTVLAFDILICLTVLLFVTVQAVRLWRGRRRLTVLALEIEERAGKLQGALSNTVQLVGRADVKGASSSLVALALEQGEQKAQSLRLQPYLPSLYPGRSWVVASCVLVIALAGLLGGSAKARVCLRSLITPRLLAHRSQGLEVFPGSALVVQGDSLQLGVRNRQGEAIRIHTTGLGTARVQPVRYGSFDSALVTIRNIKQPFSYRVRSLHRSSPLFQVDVVKRPEIDSFGVVLRYPSYMRKPKQMLESDVGDFWAPLASTARFTLVASKPLAAAALVVGEKKHVPMDIQGNKAFGSLRVQKPFEYRFFVQDRDSLTNMDPIVYRVRLLEDGPPVVSLVEPSQDVRLDRSLAIGIVALAEDDFGFSRTSLHYRIVRDDEIVPEDSILLRKKVVAKKQDSIAFVWELEELRLYPGDVLEFWAKTLDNDVITGPKVAVSQTRRARFPSAKEIFAETEREEEEMIQSLSTLQRKQEQVMQQTENLQRKLGARKKPGQKERKQLAHLSQEQDRIFQDLDSLRNAIQEKMARDLSSSVYKESVLKTMKEIRRQLQNINTDLFREALEKIAKQGARPDPKKLRQLLDQMARSQQDILSRLEQTLAFLKKIQAENQLRNMADRLADLAEQQERLRKSTLSENPQSKSANHQDRLAVNTDDMLDQMQQASQDSLFDPSMKKSIQSVHDDLRQSKVTHTMKAASQQLGQCQWQQAAASQKTASQLLQEASQKMSALASSMGQKGSRLLLEAIETMARDLLFVSFFQESLTVVPHGDLISNQQVISRELERAISGLMELGQKTGYLDPPVMSHLGKGMQASRNAAQQFGRANRQQGGLSQLRSLEYINAAVIRLQEQANAMAAMSMGAGASMEQLMEGMFSLGAEQMALNQWISSLLQQALREGNQGRMARQCRQAAAAQQSIMERYEQLRKELTKQSGRERPKGTDVKKDMREVIRDLEAGRLTHETVDKQERILSRMLDGVQSLSKRDYSKKRRAEYEETTIPRVGPDGVPTDAMRRKIGSRRIDFSLYPMEYHELIRRYLQKMEPRQ